MGDVLRAGLQAYARCRPVRAPRLMGVHVVCVRWKLRAVASAAVGGRLSGVTNAARGRGTQTACHLGGSV
jgi:hypothetical protein